MQRYIFILKQSLFMLVFHPSFHSRFHFSPTFSLNRKLLGERYNEQTNKVVGFVNQDVFASLQDEFTKNDVMTAMRRQNKKSRVTDVIYRWKKMGAIDEVDKYVYKKKNK